jgi:hypothetical protein
MYLAYYMMNESKKTLEESLAILHESYPNACPNTGFEIQLDLWRDMEFTYLPDHHGYRRWKLSRMSCQFQDYGFVQDISLSSLTPPTGGSTQKNYKCKKCRRVLVGADHVISHEAGKYVVDFNE